MTQFQVSLLEKEVVKPWIDVCCKSCWNATQDRCVCRCEGRYHGKGRVKKNRDSRLHFLKWNGSTSMEKDLRKRR